MSKIFQALVFLAGAVLSACNGQMDSEGSTQPNIIIILADDLGYGDLGCYGNPTIQTPHLDRMAQEGLKFTQFYTASPVCTPTRSALLTGCLPKRIGLHEHVLFPHTQHGIHQDEVLMSELMKAQGYHTAIFGKWHLGHQVEFLPLQHGFDTYFGIPFSNDMSRKEQSIMGRSEYPYYLPLMEGNDTIELDPDQTVFTKEFTERAVAFIRAHAGDPFFLYLPHPMPHIPIYASENFTGRSKRGDYGDTVEEIDWSVGEILKALKETGIAEQTLVIFTSDNGPWLSYKTRGGSAGPLRGGKQTTWEGGMRVPALAWWHGRIKENRVSNEVVTIMDLYPTVASLLNISLTGNPAIDGIDISRHLLKGDPLPERTVYYYHQSGPLEAMRKGPWKVSRRGDVEALYNVEEDISEKYDRSADYPELKDQMLRDMTRFDSLMDIEKRKAKYLK
jgi:arylsulfatase A-like enzyme